jgi:oligopeptide/dipeptide ABC transporter ATP-binding protein
VSQQEAQGDSVRQTLLEVRDLKKYFPVKKGIFGRHVADVKALDGVSFDLHARETLGIVGESGCGKTTLGRTILRLIEPTAGTAHFEGRDIFQLDRKSLRALRSEVQIIFQDPYSSLNPRQTIGNIIGDALELHGLVTGDARFDRAKELLERVGLQGSYINRYPHEFSGGQRQRIGIARAIALKPRFIVCDEAVSALDVSVQAQVLNLLEDLQEELELSYMFIAHDLAVVRHIADRVAVMYLGRIVELSECDDLFDQPLHPYTQALLSAIPQPDPTRKRLRILLEGDVPNPMSPPSGCHFHTRCPLVMERCRSEVPELVELRPGHWSSCHLYDGVEQPAEAILIGGAPAAAAAPAQAATHDETMSISSDEMEAPLEDDLLFDDLEMFDGVAAGDSQPLEIPPILGNQPGLILGPFGEIVDPEDSYLDLSEAPSLQSITGISPAATSSGTHTEQLRPVPGNELEDTVTGENPSEDESVTDEIAAESSGEDDDEGSGGIGHMDTDDVPTVDDDEEQS